MTIDELAHAAGVPGRTIREYQTLRLLPPPQREGRIGLYDELHLRRLRLIGRLQSRGYSLAGIRDLLEAFDGGGDLLDVLADPEHGLFEETPLMVDPEELAEMLGPLGASDRRRLAKLGLLIPAADARWCVPAPSLVRLAVATVGAGWRREDVYRALAAVASAMEQASREIVQALSSSMRAPGGPADPDALLGWSRLLLAQGAGRLLVHHVGEQLAASSQPHRRGGRAERHSGPG